MPLIDKEWANPVKARDSSKPSTRLFNLDKDSVDLFKPPLVNAPVAALGFASILSTDSESLPKGPTDKKVKP